MKQAVLLLLAAVALAGYGGPSGAEVDRALIQYKCQAEQLQERVKALEAEVAALKNGLRC